MGIRKSFVIIFALFHGLILADEKPEIYKSLNSCSASGLCSSIESLIFFPVFPWVQYLNDEEANPSQKIRFESFNYELNAFITKLNNSNSGYILDLGLFKKNLGINFTYDTFFDGYHDNLHMRTNLVFRLNPSLHIQANFELGWRYLETDDFILDGPELSFFNYNIMFSRRTHLKLANYIFVLKSNICYENIILAEYYVYPTISFKVGMNLKYVMEDMFYGIQSGFSIKLI